jgi:peptidyl-tRNA hydrolase, PTH1 family
VRLVIGLGNPGDRYAATRHNVGWRVLDELARRWRAVEVASVAGVYEARRGRVGDGAVALLRPQTYMNLSGEALERWIREAAEQPPEDLLVVSDDVYLPLGTLRLRARGSSGGHRGLESIEAALGHRDFARLRVGVGAGVDAEGMREHVLEAFGPDEEPQVDEAVKRAADAVECWAIDGIDRAMNRFNRRIRKEVSEP